MSVNCTTISGSISGLSECWTRDRPNFSCSNMQRFYIFPSVSKLYACLCMDVIIYVYTPHRSFTLNYSAKIHTQDVEPNDSNIPASSIWEVVDQTLIRPCVRELGVVDEDGGTGGWHCHCKPHSPIKLGCTIKNLTPLVNNNLENKDMIPLGEK